MKFKRSSKCSTGTCVEVRIGSVDSCGKSVTVRDDVGTYVFFTTAEWTAFVEGVKLGEFDIK
jgi:hypothetical protein